MELFVPLWSPFNDVYHHHCEDFDIYIRGVTGLEIILLQLPGRSASRGGGGGVAYFFITNVV